MDEAAAEGSAARVRTPSWACPVGAAGRAPRTGRAGVDPGVGEDALRLRGADGHRAGTAHQPGRLLDQRGVGQGFGHGRRHVRGGRGAVLADAEQGVQHRLADRQRDGDARKDRARPASGTEATNVTRNPTPRVHSGTAAWEASECPAPASTTQTAANTAARRVRSPRPERFVCGWGQSWRAHHRTGPPAAVRQVRKESYDRKITYVRGAPHTPVGFMAHPPYGGYHVNGMLTSVYAGQ